jgi:hypothetical protein
MGRLEATRFAVAAGLIVLLLCTIAYGIGAGEAILYVGLVSVPVVTLIVYWQLRRRPQP